MVFLPEAADYIGESKAQSVELAERIEGDTIAKYRTLAKSLGVWLSVGGFHQKVLNNVMFFFITKPGLIGLSFEHSYI